MLYQHSNPSPYLSTIDATDTNNFKVQINGDKVDSYVLNIYDLDNNSIDNIGTYTSPITLTNPIYGNMGVDSELSIAYPVSGNTTELSNGREYKWNLTIFQEAYDIAVTQGRVIENSTTASIKIYPHPYYLLCFDEDNTLKSLKINIGGKTFTVSSYTLHTNTSTNVADYGIATITGTNIPSFSKGTPYVIYTNSITNVMDYCFNTNSTPTVSATVYDNGATATVTNNVVSLTSSIIKVNLAYSQTENVGIKHWGVELSNGEEIIDEIKEQYNSKIEYSYDSLLSGETYSLKFRIVNNGEVEVTYDLTVTPTYTITESNFSPVALVDIEKGATVIELGDIRTINSGSNFTIEDTDFTDVKYGSMTATKKAINLSTNDSIWWDSVGNNVPLTINDSNIITICSTDLTPSETPILELNTVGDYDKFSLGYDGTNCWWKIKANGETTIYSTEVYTGGTYVNDNTIFYNSNSDFSSLYSTKSSIKQLAWSESENEYWSNSSSLYLTSYELGEQYYWKIQIDLSKAPNLMVTIDYYDIIT